jgi:tetratricopeptide (TPR) repeat protein
MAYQRLDMIPDAVIELQKAVELGPNEVFLRIDLARVLWGQNRLKEAEWHALEAERIDPDDPWSYAVRSWVAEAQGDLPQARTLADIAFERQARKALNSGSTYAEAGFLCLFIDRLNEADTYFDKAVRLGLTEFDVFAEKGWIRSQRRDWEGAVDAFQRALKLRPDDSHMHNELAQSLLRAGRVEDAIAEYRESIALGENYRAHYSLWEVYYARGDLPEAVAELESAVGLPMPARLAPLLWKTLGIAYEEAGRGDSALSAYRQAVKLNPEDAISRYLLASLFLTQGDLSGAMKEARVAIALAEADGDRDTSSMAHYLMAMAYDSQGDSASAISEQQMAVSRAEAPADKAFYMWKLGTLLQKSGRSSEAIASFDSVVQLDPENPLYYYYRGLAYAGNGDSARAMDDLKKAQRLAEEQGDQELVRLIRGSIEQ